MKIKELFDKKKYISVRVTTINSCGIRGNLWKYML